MKLFSHLLLLLVFILLNNTAFSQTAVKPQGEGTEASPYLISNWQELYWFSQTDSVWDKHFLQTADIDFVDAEPSIEVWEYGTGWDYRVEFNGTYDGNGKSINSLFLKTHYAQNVGFFTSIRNKGKVQNVTLVDANVIGADGVAILAGENAGFIENCSVIGSEVVGQYRVAVIVSTNEGEIKDCYIKNSKTIGHNQVAALSGYNSGQIFSCNIEGSTVLGRKSVGSVAGVNYGQVKRCYGDGYVFGLECVGGFIGFNGGRVEDSYCSALVERLDDDEQNTSFGGFYGNSNSNKTARCYSTGRVIYQNDFPPVINGFVAGLSNDYSFEYCYWNIQTSGQKSTGNKYFENVVGLTNAEMREKSNFVSWDFDSVWNIDPNYNNGLPYLKKMGGDQAKISVSVTDVSGSEIVLSGTLATNDEVLEYGFFGGTDTVYSLTSDFDFINKLGSASDFATFQGKIEGLQNGSKYYCMPYAITSTDTVYGNLLIITTHTLPSAVPLGDGTAESPFLISNWKELLWLSLNERHCDKHFLQTKDIDFADAEPAIETWNKRSGWLPIGQNGGFSGVYDGNNYLIRGLWCDESSIDAGLFSRIEQTGVVCGVGIVNAEIHAHWNAAGIIAGSNNGNIYQCYVSGEITGSKKIGAFVGSNSGKIADCFSVSNVYKKYRNGADLGGFVGSNSSHIYRCYSLGRVYDENQKPMLNNSFLGNTLGDTSVVENCYWNKEIASSLNSSMPNVDINGVYGLTIAEMQQDSSFRDWDFSDVWKIDSDHNFGFPYLSSGIGVVKSPFVRSHSETAFTVQFDGYVLAEMNTISEYGIIGSEELPLSLENDSLRFKKTFTAPSKPEVIDVNVVGLNLNTTYHYCSYIIAGNDTIYGKLDSFKTHSLPSATPKGNGTDESPYLISNWQELLWVSLHPELADRHFLQTADIDFAEAEPEIKSWNNRQGWAPIQNFSGSYDGGGKKVAHLYCSRSSGNFVGLFNRISEGGIVQNVGLESVYFSGDEYVGAIAGAVYEGEVRNCYSTGTVDGYNYIGGLVGKVGNGYSGSVSVINSYSRANVRTGYFSGSEYISGFAGYHTNTALIQNCYVLNKISKRLGDWPSNGFVATEADYRDSLKGNFWNVQMSGLPVQPYSNKFSTPLVNSEMVAQSTYLDAGWDFILEDENGTDDVWAINPGVNDGFPFLVPKYSISGDVFAGVRAISSSFIEFDVLFIKGEDDVKEYGVVGAFDSISSLSQASIEFREIFENTSETVQVLSTVNGLEHNSQYWYRTYIITASDTVWGESFKAVTRIASEAPQGTGESADDPYLIENLQNLYWVADQTNNFQRDFDGSFFLQTKDIDASSTRLWNNGTGWKPIGCDSVEFQGNYNGDGHSIKGIWIDNLSEQVIFVADTVPAGLWGTVGKRAVIQNISLKNSTVKNRLSTGLLAGVSKGVISDCSVEGLLHFIDTVGGLVGMNFGEISASSAQCSFIYKGRSKIVGGFVGINKGIVSKSKCHLVDVQEVTLGYFGGFCGINSGDINQCGATGVAFRSDWDVAGFIIKNTGAISNSYTLVKEVFYGFVAQNSGSVLNSYYATADSYQFLFASGGTLSGNFANFFNEYNGSDPIGVTYLTTTELQHAARFIDAGWDFVGETANGTDDIWIMHPNYNYGYPFFAWDAPQFTYIGGNVYYDRDKSGTETDGDVSIGGIEVELLPLGTVTHTSSDGSYVFYADPGKYTVIVKPSDPYLKGTDSLKIAVETELLKDSVLPSVGLYGTDVLDFDVSLSTVWTRCGNTVPVWAVVQNNGNVSGDASLQVKLSSLVVYEESDVAPVSVDEDGTLLFDLNDLGAYENRIIKIMVTAPVATMNRVKYKAGVMYGGEVVATDSISRLIRCSYDPNDVQVFPEGEDSVGTVPMDQELTYLIRFQNTGNDTAFMVDVYDTLSPTLDPASFELLGSSHPVRHFVNPNGSMRFLFEDINLLDSTSNEPESHGFVKFKVKPIADIVSGDIATLRASIYFDYNPPVVTNTVLSTFVEQEELALVIYPTIATDNISISSNKTGSYVITNVAGNEVFSGTIEAADSDTTIAVADFADGVYTIVLTVDNETVQNQFVKKTETVADSLDVQLQSNSVVAELYIKSNQPVVIKIFDDWGSLVLSDSVVKINEFVSVDVSSLGQDVYTMSVSSGDQDKVFSLMVLGSERSVSFSTDGNGTISGSTEQTVTHGSSSGAVEAVANEGYSFVGWKNSEGVVVSLANPLVFDSVVSDIILTAYFASELFAVTVAESEFGKLVGLSEFSVGAGDAASFQIVPVEGYHFVEWIDKDGNVLSSDNPYTVEDIQSDLSVEPVLAINVYSFIAQSAGKGTVSVSPDTAEFGSAVAFTIIPDAGYRLDSAVYNNEHVTDLVISNQLSIESVYENGNLQAYFSLIHKVGLNNDSNLPVLFPNPANSVVCVEGVGIENITIQDSKGTVVSNKKYKHPSDKIYLSVDGLPVGVYTVKIEVDGDVSVQQLIVY